MEKDDREIQNDDRHLALKLKENKKLKVRIVCGSTDRRIIYERSTEERERINKLTGKEEEEKNN